MRKVLIFIFGIILGFILGGLLMYGYWVYQDYMLEKNANEIYMQDECYQYHYAQLTSKQQMAYKKIYYCIKNRMDCVMVDVVDVKETEKIYYSVIDDHPEFYYVLSSFDYIESDCFIIFPDYSYTQDEINEINQRIADKTDMIIDKTKELNNIEKIKTIYQYIIDITEYKRNTDDQNIKSVFIENESVCAGYARAYQYLLNKAGIDASYMGGKAIDNNEGHAWVMISLDNHYYYSDPTWGDIVTAGMEHSCYAYFMMSSDEMLHYYIPDTNYEITLEDGYHYFKDVGCYMEEYDKSIVDKAVKIGLSNKSRVAEIRCADKKVFERLKREIENNYLGYYVLKSNGCYSDESKYLCDEKTLMVELYY